MQTIGQALLIRQAKAKDYAPIIAVVDEWWGGRQMHDMLPKLFFVHFRETSLVAEANGELAGFLCGFLSQTFPDEAYIHFVGVNPKFRKAGVGRALYVEFFRVARACSRNIIRCVTAPVNKTSIAFHTRMGFEIEPGDKQIDGVSVHMNYDGEGGDRVLFVKRLAPAA